ncbi:hypothetical protein NIES2100_07090 [Calothrix sp. NIES-2100]|uniref:hypothetical protein n=1 Tax=Calothrix sp. NIES-2100 TaxID=1954172 RepID=UPI000B6125D9|nr:hypothetical protein NIES2100_07090 [Calothrix sp. NIES-2100]
MKHNFFFVEGKIKYSSFSQFNQMEPDAVLHDDVMRYLRDSSQWVQSIQVSFPYKRESYGLDEYGTNIIDEKGAKTFYGVICAWKDLFSQAPEVFEITTGVVCDHEGRAKYPLEFIKVSLNRDFLVENLQKLSEYAKQAAHGDGYILHLGM